jgi:hypothetical protein
VDTQNHFYGHSAVLAAWCGIGRPRHIQGLVQHGWTSSSPVTAVFADFPRVGGPGSRRRLVVWSHESRAWSPEHAARPTTAVGAPWSYLDRLAARVGRAAGPAPAEGPTVVLPVHGTRIMRLQGDQRALAQSVREHEGVVTACLHAEDCLDPDLVRAWAAAGHRLVTLGRRTDPAFLLRLYSLLSSAKRVVSNRLSTAILYAASIDRDVAVHLDPMVHGYEPTAVLEHNRATWPELHGPRTDPAAVGPLARAELGADALLDPAALSAVLGWDRRRPGPAVDYWLGAPMTKALAVLGLRARAEGALEKGTEVPVGQWLRHPLAHLPGPLPGPLPAGAWPEPLPVRP